MDRKQNIFDIIRAGDSQRFIEVVDRAFKEAAREASARSHVLGLPVAHGRVDEDIRRSRSRRAIQAE
jgi:hypothetical protein